MKDDDSPNPPHAIGRPLREPEDQARQRLYEYHKSSGSLGTFYEMYPAITEQEMRSRKSWEKIAVGDPKPKKTDAEKDNEPEKSRSRGWGR